MLYKFYNLNSINSSLADGFIEKSNMPNTITEATQMFAYTQSLNYINANYDGSIDGMKNWNFGGIKNMAGLRFVLKQPWPISAAKSVAVNLSMIRM